jgi:hypothetical protein
MQSMTAEQQFCCSQSEHAVQPAQVMASGDSVHEPPLLPLLLATAPQMGATPLPLPLEELLLDEPLLEELLELLPPGDPLPLPLLVPEPLALDETELLLLPLLPPLPEPLLVEDPVPLEVPLLLDSLPLDEPRDPLLLLLLPDMLPLLPVAPSGESYTGSPTCPLAQAHARPDSTARQTTSRFIGEALALLESRNRGNAGRKNAAPPDTEGPVSFGSPTFVTTRT